MSGTLHLVDDRVRPGGASLESDTLDGSLREALTLAPARARPIYCGAKRTADIFVAVMLGLTTLPVTVIAAVLILLIDRHSPLFFDRRVGKHGKSFHCCKLRTMTAKPGILEAYLDQHPDERRQYEVSRKLTSDPRITGIGRVLRSSSIDELPQLFNVLRGEMSIVGPRPLAPGEFACRGRYSLRLASVKPGLTGLWQVRGRSKLSIRTRKALDECYVRRASFLLDLKLMLVTPWAILTRRGAR